MTTEHTLDKADITKIIAKEFGVRPNAVDLEVVPTCVGYGRGEHTEHVIQATVSVGKSNQ